MLCSVKEAEELDLLLSCCCLRVQYARRGSMTTWQVCNLTMWRWQWSKWSSFNAWGEGEWTRWTEIDARPASGSDNLRL